LRISPGAYLNEIVGDKRDGTVFQYLLEKLNQLPIAYVHTGSFNDAQTYEELHNMTMSAFIRSHYNGTVIACGSYSFERAENAIANQAFDLVAIGRPFIANPDLIKRLQAHQELTSYDSQMLNTLI
jgi:2,4-dienoyl-CoA reductase-like NADH-dependent reductase (Old Yellow Enzyme family)